MSTQSTPRSSQLRILLGIPLLALLLAYCSSPETTVVDREPEAGTTGSGDTVQTEVSGDDFKHLRVGTIYPIHSLDPLFASNPAELRTLQALYETLVKYNEHGELVPALASDWEIGEDSLQYTFQLRSNVYYHDSRIFANGIGRRVVADDVVHAFYRMARAGVPGHAASMFSGIKGFDPYLAEQHQVYLEKLRKINSIDGIRAVDENTVRFILKRKDPLFLNKLASPFASIYPIEATRNSENHLHTNPVGSGPYQFTEMAGDSSLVLERFDNYVYKTSPSGSDLSSPPLDRIDINYFSNQRQLLRYLSNDDIDLIHEMSPQLKNMVLDGQGNAKDLKFNYQVHETNARPVISIRRNTQSDEVLNTDQATYLDRAIQSDLFNLLTPVKNEIQTLYHAQPTATTGNPPELPSRIYGSFSDDPVVNTYYRALATEVNSNSDSKFSVLPIRVPVSDTQLYGDHLFQLRPEKAMIDTTVAASDLIHTFSLQQYAISDGAVEGVGYNELPWWVNYGKLNLTIN